MSDIAFYHDGSRELQDRFQTRRLAARLQEVIAHDVLTDADRAFTVDEVCRVVEDWLELGPAHARLSGRLRSDPSRRGICPPRR